MPFHPEENEAVIIEKNNLIQVLNNLGKLPKLDTS